VKVVWTELAVVRLGEIEAHVARRDPVVAEALVERLLARSETLADHPEAGRRVAEVPTGELRELVEPPYRLVYRVRGGEVQVITVFHGRRMFPRDVADLG
jgi:toxin ParE1/3/4